MVQTTDRLSKQMEECKFGNSKLQLSYHFESNFGYFSHPWYFHGSGGYLLFFDPWTGNVVKGSITALCLDESVNKEKWLDERLKIRKQHNLNNEVCSLMFSFLKSGDEEGMTSIIHVPNIRTYAILNKKEYGGFEGMDFCPFCGAKFPQRLDGKLTEILQAEYGLLSWRDYKKAPHEFHTDEWWKKRGL